MDETAMYELAIAYQRRKRWEAELVGRVVGKHVVLEMAKAGLSGRTQTAHVGMLGMLGFGQI